jgi:multiple antibiotic resistance protein
MPGVGLEFALAAFVTLFVIVDPFANMPIFAGLLERFDPAKRAATVRRAHVIALAVMLLFTVAGEHLLGFLGIELFALRVAGGVLLFVIAFEMLFGRRTRTEYSEGEEEEARTLERIAASPLAVPLMTGPGAISTGILLWDEAASALDKGLLLLDVVLVFALSYVLLSNAGPLFRRLGVTGTTVAVRIMGLLLSAIAVQFVVRGLQEALAAAALGAA